METAILAFPEKYDDGIYTYFGLSRSITIKPVIVLEKEALMPFFQRDICGLSCKADITTLKPKVDLAL